VDGARRLIHRAHERPPAALSPPAGRAEGSSRRSARTTRAGGWVVPGTDRLRDRAVANRFVG
jgi:hypothetical protein